MEFPILKDIVIIFALSTGVNFLFTKIKVPGVIGYLLTGIIAGPHLLKLVGSEHEIELMAEIGVALLLFTIGMEFSLKHLIKIRRLVFFGGFMQVALTALAFYGISKFYSISWLGGLFVGFLSALSSSALVLKLLQERGQLSSNYGRTVLGILIFQDLMLVPLLLFTNLMSGHNPDILNESLWLGLKAIGIVGMVYIGHKWVMPRILHLIAQTKNEELFMMSIFLICLSVALLTSHLGMSLAFGAFLAGLMISESEYSHNAFGNLILFKDTFTSFFFVSIGMLLDASFVVDNWQMVLWSVLLVIVVKTFISGGVGFVLGHTFRGTMVVGFALSQVGEFSFILAKIGYSSSLITPYIYQLFLSVAVITMALTPFLMSLSLPVANLILKLPLPEFVVEGLFPLKEVEIPELKSHMVIIGKDRSALELSSMATYYKIPHVSIVFDPSIVREKMQNGDMVVYGDAVNEPILRKARIEDADVVVISVGEIIPAMAIVDRVRELNEKMYLIVRAKFIHNVEQLYSLGADLVLPEKLEIALDLFNRVLVNRHYSRKEISRMMMKVRNLYLGKYTQKDKLNQPSILDELTDVHVAAWVVEKESDAENRSIKELGMKKKHGITVLAIKKDSNIIEHPDSNTLFIENDIAYVLGPQHQIEIASDIFLGEKNS